MENCEHYWVIPNTPTGTCHGICRKCGASKEFLNRMPINQDWESPVRLAKSMVYMGQYIDESIDE